MLINELSYIEPRIMKIRKLIYKLENKKTFKDLGAKTIPINNLGEKLHE